MHLALPTFHPSIYILYAIYKEQILVAEYALDKGFKLILNPERAFLFLMASQRVKLTFLPKQANIYRPVVYLFNSFGQGFYMYFRDKRILCMKVKG
jgi:hypothetical protein